MQSRRFSLVDQCSIPLRNKLLPPPGVAEPIEVGQYVRAGGYVKSNSSGSLEVNTWKDGGDWVRDRLMGAALHGPIGREQRRVRASWLIRLRWVAIFGQLAVVGPALSTGWLGSEHLAIYVSIVCGLAIFNVAVYLLSRKEENPSSGSLVLQVAVDLCALGALLVLTGGVYNPMAPIAFVHASLGPLLFRGVWSYVVGLLLLALVVVISGFPVLPLALGQPAVGPVIQGMAHVIVSLVIWVLTTWLAASLHRHQALVESLRVAQARQDRLRVTGMLAAGFCHELATPLNTLGLRLNRVEQQMTSSSPDIRVMRESLERCEEVLQSMIGQRLESDDLRFELLHPVELIAEVTHEWSNGGREVRFEAGECEHIEWLLPRMLLTQSIVDLLDNAHHALTSISAPDPIDVKIDERSGFLEIAVEDVGPGVPAAVRPHLGQPFVTSKPEGSGLGLFNANNLCVALGGGLIIEDGPVGGARVVLRLGSASVQEEAR